MAWTLIKGQDGYDSSEHKEWMVDAASDVTVAANIHDEGCAAGSVAYTADLSLLYMKDANGTWKSI